MLYLICYDIENDRLRSKVAKTLEKAQLQRIQYSVFLGEVSEKNLKDISIRIEKIRSEASDFNVICIPLHQPVIDTIFEIGDKPIDWAYFKGEKDF
ncbi:CRISPR-associated protein, Cas2 family [Spirosomataceae bacterium TFI 002]|nr:CRISPR-associated protein, Cas2 family [Spirosomataceae bacterium TFI 002]